MGIQATAFAGGFADPVFQSQAVFRVIMDCMARPGTIGDLSIDVAPPAPMSRAQGAIALCLADQDTPVCLTAGLAGSVVPRWLAFHAGASVTTEKSSASLAFSEVDAPFPALAAFASGSQDYPDRSTMIVAEIEGLSGGTPLSISGPGIKDRMTISPRGLPRLFTTLWGENRRLFPRGVDLVLTSGDACLCLPRSVRIVSEEHA